MTRFLRTLKESEKEIVDKIGHERYQAFEELIDSIVGGQILLPGATEEVVVVVFAQ